MINSVLLRNVATYDNTGSAISDLKEINIIYGANGSGKTTLSNYLNDTEDGRFSDCKVTWKNNQPMKVLVYNKEFREKNFNTGTIEGVFTLGNATKEDLALIEQKQGQLTQIKDEGAQKRRTLDAQKASKLEKEEAFRETVWKELYKKYETTFKEAFRGFLQKESFKNKLLDEYETNKSTLLSLPELEEKAKTIFGDEPTRLDEIRIINYVDVVSLEKEEIWKTKIIGKADVDIAKMIQKLGLNDWVNQGKDFIQDDVCPFCQQNTITEEFKKQLEEYFDETFLKATKTLELKCNKYQSLTQNLINELTAVEAKEKQNKNTKLDVEKFSAYFKTFLSQVTTNNERINNKQKEASRSIELVTTEEQLEHINSLINSANDAIKKHNGIVENFKSEKVSLIKSAWKFIIEECKDKIQSYLKETGGLQKGIEKLDGEVAQKRTAYKALDNEIKELNKNVTSVQPTIDEINRLLKYYGFLNFEIVPSAIESNHYQIKREDGTLAESTLSEGEVTFITFLYFMQLAKGSKTKDTISEERVLVVDDPISSLDSNVLFIVSTLLKNVINDIKNNKGNIKQILILTHNVYFHKEISFIDSRQKENNKTEYWILRKKNKISTFHHYGRKNPIQTSYELLWRELKEKELNSNITIKNTMRRIIEKYFKILGNYKDEHLVEKFNTFEEQQICKSLISWVNDGSHSVPDALYVETEDNLTEKNLEVFKRIFELTGHLGHYQMMMGIEASESTE